jgi:type VI secretion system secreted protein Hcp
MIGDNFMWFPESTGGWKAEGETSDTFFAAKKAFEILNFKFTMDNKETVDAPGGKGGTGGKPGSAAGKAKFAEFEIDKEVDSASVPLYRACSTGQMIPTIMLAIRKAGGSGLIYLQYVFRYAHVTGITWSGGTGEEGAVEKMTFSFKALGVQYIAQKADGTPGKRQAWSWNTAVQGDKSGSPSLDIPGVDPPPDFVQSLT